MKTMMGMAAACAVLGAVMLSAPAQAWPEGAPPSGSFTKSCKLYSYDNATMRLLAQCTRKNGKKSLVRDWLYRYCVGDISNQDGYLHCNIDKAKAEADYAAAQAKSAAELAQKQAAEQAAKEKAEAEAAKAAAAAQLKGSKPAFDAAGIVVLGYMPTDSERAQLIAMMKGPPYNMADQASEQNISFVDATKFLRQMLVQPGKTELRANTITFAYLSVWGREPTAVEFAAADARVAAGSAWYAPIVGEQQARMRKDDALHAALIDDAFDAATGRDPTAAERASWMAKPHDYSHAVRALRQWLYSSAGATERVETTRRALAAKGLTPTDDLLKKAMIEYGKTEAIYDEMLTSGPAGKPVLQLRRVRLSN